MDHDHVTSLIYNAKQKSGIFENTDRKTNKKNIKLYHENTRKKVTQESHAINFPIKIQY